MMDPSAAAGPRRVKCGRQTLTAPLCRTKCCAALPPLPGSRPP